MKKDALTFFKNNMSELYQNYYQKSTNDWMEEAYGGTVFEDFIEIPDFELASLYGKSAGEIDFENCKIVYENLIMLSESQASDERLWAGLCNNIFYDYMRRRFKYDENKIKDENKDMTGIISRFFYKNSGRSGFFRNSLSKSWWVGRLAYDSQSSDKFIRLSYLGSSDFSTKVSDIFYSNTFTSNPEILKGICNAMQQYSEKGIKLVVKDHIRPAMQYLNAVGGGTLLDFYTETEIEKIVIKRIYEVASKKGVGFDEVVDEEDLAEELFDSEDAEQLSMEEQEDTDELIIGDFVEEEEEEEERFITYGSTVKLLTKETQRIMDRTIHSQQEFQNDQINELERRLLGKKVGYETYLAGKHFQVIEIV